MPNQEPKKILEFISWDHVFVVFMSAFVMYLFSLNSENNIRMFDWVVMYGVMLANIRAMKSAR